ERRRRAQAAGSDQEGARVEQAQLSLLADLGDQRVSAVPRALCGGERARQDGGEAVSLPVGEPAGERGDLLVAELLKGLRGEGRAAPARAIHDQLAPAVADGLLDSGLERAARDVDRARDVALVPFVALADVDQQWRAA